MNKSIKYNFLYNFILRKINYYIHSTISVNLLIWPYNIVSEKLVHTKYITVLHIRR